MDSGDCETEEDSPLEACVSPEGSLLPRETSDINRISRRTAEKRRRDRLASYIHELARLVPMIAKSARKMDKTSILRLTATHLLIHQTLTNGNKEKEFPKIDQSSLDQLVYEQLNGFLLVVTSRGSIVFVSSGVEQLLGHMQTDLMGQSLYNLTLSEDHDVLRLNLTCESTASIEWRKHFNIRLKRAGTRTEPPSYETVNFRGLLKPKNNGSSPTNYSTSKDLAQAGTSHNNLLIFFVRVYRPEFYMDRLVEASKSEYVTRHLLDGKIVSCDQRISLVAGYMSEEVSGLCAFNFMHRQDVRWVMIALRQMYDKGENKGMSCYRLLSKTGEFIYLKTYGYLEIDSSGVVESFICVNSLTDEEEGKELTKEMKRKYSAIIKSNETNFAGREDVGVPAVEDPAELEMAVAHLIANLPSPGGSEYCSTPSPPCSLPAFESQDCQNMTDTSNSSLNPLAIKISKQASKRPPPNHIDVQMYNKRAKTTDNDVDHVNNIDIDPVAATSTYQMINTETPVLLPPPTAYPVQAVTQNVNVESSSYKQNHMIGHNI
ncbi:neuronal PAS domain-containing protein 2 isoform X2 [Agrilus planipennis]|uniref:Neuronal PAS domain-containing protein 2 isoform X2 n=1 Tax=Agrilus planipennis TaxID=224129 RepID=A0A7F5RLF1_AGRPL|nr:neuronal PAS domain-containing protein 2 isoform X2 [Agrilus planipennis]